MKNLKIDLSKDRLWLVLVAMVLLNSACNSQPPAKTLHAESTPIPSASTPIPSSPTPLPPTTTPTATLLPGAAGYLLTIADLPAGFEWTNSFEAQSYAAPLENKALYNTIFYTDGGWLHVVLTVANEPFEKIPDGLSYGQGGTPVDTVLVGQSSQAYLESEDPLKSSFVFIKGNVLVELLGPISVDTALKLAQIMEARIPELVSDLTPITFPEALDSETYAKYFSSISLGLCSSDDQSFTPASVFSSQDWTSVCIQMLPMASQDLARFQKYSYADYVPQDQNYVAKYSSAHGFSGTIFTPQQPGQYEMRIAVDDVLVAVLPFEVH